ncbi:uncharacterized protein MONOS_1088 [Monocercomonoides exilis]|uniref:uncharacterized protein n=1 Tax=Monocercomonoides exilis TaxID=2049356 RepID=UPI0035597E8A|nr:hypothetical protein MONOS_1088 [Monocercomonoides exilis]|eukprot:MONOS_1088.1-p1 / transcript=MONOS_1088.1 / gene=MONOS_1088 / organism=Monocercomonoides_exilis_PA203 / gene_product=unspecified product / transcript_product=unspecified product / location=Mono_scaffold00018:171437-172557(-) / protein_length=307 / sequence_SO=supercontig / SO=protein_coding / is_pseudo=false
MKPKKLKNQKPNESSSKELKTNDISAEQQQLENSNSTNKLRESASLTITENSDAINDKDRNVLSPSSSEHSAQQNFEQACKLTMEATEEFNKVKEELENAKDESELQLFDSKSRHDSRMERLQLLISQKNDHQQNKVISPSKSVSNKKMHINSREAHEMEKDDEEKLTELQLALGRATMPFNSISQLSLNLATQMNEMLKEELELLSEQRKESTIAQNSNSSSSSSTLSDSDNNSHPSKTTCCFRFWKGFGRCTDGLNMLLVIVLCGLIIWFSLFTILSQKEVNSFDRPSNHAKFILDPYRNLMPS